MSRHASSSGRLLLPASVFRRAHLAGDFVRRQAKRIEIDRTTILPSATRAERSPRSAPGVGKGHRRSEFGQPYRIIEATTRYDCVAQCGNAEARVQEERRRNLREEEPKSAELPVRSGTVDDTRSCAKSASRPRATPGQGPKGQ